MFNKKHGPECELVAGPYDGAVIKTEGMPILNVKGCLYVKSNRKNRDGLPCYDYIGPSSDNNSNDIFKSFFS